MRICKDLSLQDFTNCAKQCIYRHYLSVAKYPNHAKLKQITNQRHKSEWVNRTDSLKVSESQIIPKSLKWILRAVALRMTNLVDCHDLPKASLAMTENKHKKEQKNEKF